MAHSTTQAPTQLQTHTDPRIRAAPSTGIFILVVEDNTLNRKIGRRILEKLGHTVDVVCDGQEALDYLCKTSGKRQPDIVFMDTSMPVLDGYEATRRIRNDADRFDGRTRSLPIIATSPFAQTGEGERCHEAAMDDWIPKPLRPKTFNAAVLKWMSPMGP